MPTEFVTASVPASRNVAGAMNQSPTLRATFLSTSDPASSPLLPTVLLLHNQRRKYILLNSHLNLLHKAQKWDRTVYAKMIKVGHQILHYLIFRISDSIDERIVVGWVQECRLPHTVIIFRVCEASH